MNAKIVIGVGIAIAIVIGIVFAYSMSDQESPQPVDDLIEEEPQNTPRLIKRGLQESVGVTATP